MKTSEHFYHAILMLVQCCSGLGIIWSILLINEGGAKIREQELEMFEGDELAWNNTYMNQIKGIEINIIKDGFLYN
jgi:hypothetical protein